ncbi:MAG TPA: non-homologous end-joining DNA ligase [Nitriliruptorales bacterium]|nr:non-homologous end-joining DNA ligase [Nitriliruptorales bacterium]
MRAWQAAPHESFPERVAPMLAVAGDIPDDDRSWAYEFKWDGVRAVALCRDGSAPLISRNGNDLTVTYPELATIDLRGCDAVLDGEIVALDASGRPSFTRLQQRFGVADRTAAALRSHAVPVVYLAFDLLHLDARRLTELPLQERRALLEALPVGGVWHVPASHHGEGHAVLQAARSLGLEGVVAKRLGSRYEPGRRSHAWRKVKLPTRERFLIGGWLPASGGRAGTVGALLLGQYDVDPASARRRRRPQRLVYVGSVGSGFTAAELDALGRLLAELRRETSPFELGTPRPGATWVEPRLVVEVGYRDWTPAGVIRQSVYGGRRDGGDHRQVVREPQR